MIPLQVPFSEKDAAKSLGARWDAVAKLWYVPDGVDPAPFARWMGAQSTKIAEDLTTQTDAPVRSRFAWGRKSLAAMSASNSPSVVAQSPALTDSSAGLPTPSRPEGVSLATLMAGVAKAVDAAYRNGVWVRSEVVKADLRNGHVYLELAERDESGKVAAQARAVIWASTASRIVAAFERTTGVVLGAGIKLLVRARPTVHALYGLSLIIDAIDHDFTLGDLEAKKREIRERLRREGLFDRNRQLPAPWDFNRILVVAPEAAAGLGDFKAESDRLASWGVCEFYYAHARFQGDGAPDEICQALSANLARLHGQDAGWLDAVVIIRGGGATNDLAWLNDYNLARLICESPVPVFTGIGHERDNTILDEVAHTRFDTPSKVILGIESRIRERAKEASDFFSGIMYWGEQAAQQSRASIQGAKEAIARGALACIDTARNTSTTALGQVRFHAGKAVKDAASAASREHAQVLNGAAHHLEMAIRNVPALRNDIIERAGRQIDTVATQMARCIKDVAAGAHATVEMARSASEALMREIAGQGPEKTLRRGFALVRDEDGVALTSADQAAQAEWIQIEFHDGRLVGQVDNQIEGDRYRG
mgnify:CR=1 FL=1